MQSDDTDGTTANEDEALHQQPNNTRATFGSGLKQRDHALTSKARCGITKKQKEQSSHCSWESCPFLLHHSCFCSPLREKLYEEKLRQQKEELKQLHEERQRLIEIQSKIQDLQWACPDLQVLPTVMQTRLPLQFLRFTKT